MRFFTFPNILVFLPLLALSLLSKPIVAAPEIELSSYDHVNLRLLLSKDATHQKIALRSIYSTATQNPRVYDLVAHQLANYPKSQTYEVDTHAWFFRALGASGNMAYLATMKASLAEVAESNKLNRYYENVRRDLNVNGPAFSIQDVNLFEYEIALRQQQQNFKKTLDPEDVLGFEHCTDLSEVIDSIGYPDHVSISWDTHRVRIRTVPFVRFNLNLSEIALTYDGTAVVLFSRTGSTWCSVGGYPHREPASTETLNIPDNMDLDLVRRYAWSQDPQLLRNLVQRLARMPNLNNNILVLDELMLRVWNGRFDNNPNTYSAIAHMAKIVSRSENPRYWTVMNELRETTNSAHLIDISHVFRKRYQASGEQFDPTKAMGPSWHPGPAPNLAQQLAAMPQREQDALAMLLSGEPELRKKGAKRLTGQHAHTVSLDAAAEILISASRSGSLDVATQRTLTKLLVLSYSGRYYDNLKDLREHSTGKSVDKWLNEAEVFLTLVQDPYEPGSLDLDLVSDLLQ